MRRGEDHLVWLVMRGAHGLSMPAKSALEVLAAHCDGNPKATPFPGVVRVAACMGCGQSLARSGLAENVRVGWIKRLPGTGHGFGNPTKYSIDFDAMREPAAVFDETSGATLIVAKAPDVQRINAADVRRINAPHNAPRNAPDVQQRSKAFKRI